MSWLGNTDHQESRTESKLTYGQSGWRLPQDPVGLRERDGTVGCSSGDYAAEDLDLGMDGEEKQ